MSSGSPLPEQFDKYSILGHLATGGMAEVYLARQGGLEGFEKIVVIKRVRPDLMGDREVTSSFLDEARLVATLQHPNIAQVYEVGFVSDSYFLVMEYVHGADLRQVMQRATELKRPISLANALHVVAQVCEGIHYAHEKRDLRGRPLEIVHRDITPSNVLISHDGAVKVCDFGVAKATNKSTETARGVLKGKYSYMSPEQCRGQALDRRSDIFSLGIVLYELTTLTKLFTGESDFERLRKIVDGEVPRPASRVKHYPRELEAIVLRALAKDPAQRYQTARGLQVALDEFARDLRLIQSSASIQTVMNDLFDDRLEPWLAAQKQGKQLGDFLVDTSVRSEP
ncbi:MAG TPA: serine/threonine-protein kinase, partial [Kofleriaceae bacterium]|nr:serine/threonine-protein kinase [Kofleriaceae bacterium]